MAATMAAVRLGARPVSRAAVALSNQRRTAADIMPAGPGGRSSVSGASAVVFGATGFLGRYVVNRFAMAGSQVVIPFRGDEHDTRHLRVTGDLGAVHFLLLNEASVAEAVKHANIVINVVGIDADTRHFAVEDVHETGAEIIAKAARDAGVERLIHVSALGANPNSESRFLASKARGEERVLEAFPTASIVRPALMYGHEDRFLNRIAGMPIPLFDGGAAVKRPVYVLDVADGIMEVLVDPNAAGETFEFYGDKSYTMEEIVTYVNRTIRKPNKTIYVPSAIARPMVRMLERLPLDPILTEEMVLQFCSDDVFSATAGTFDHYDFQPTSMEQTALAWLRRYRSPSVHDDIMELQK